MQKNSAVEPNLVIEADPETYSFIQAIGKIK